MSASPAFVPLPSSTIPDKQSAAGQALADDEPTPIALIGGAVLWLIRLAVAPVSTAGGFRTWVVEECLVAPGRKAPRPRTPPRQHKAIATLPCRPPAAGRRTKPGKQARLIDLAGQRHNLAAVPLTGVSRIANTIAAEIGLAPGTARRVLLAHVRALHNSSQPAHREREEARP